MFKSFFKSQNIEYKIYDQSVINALSSKGKRKLVISRMTRDMAKPNLIKLIIALIFMSIAGAMTGLIAYLIKPFINKIFVLKQEEYVYFVGIALVLVFTLRGVAEAVAKIILSHVGIGIANNARKNLYNKFISQDVAFFSKNSPSKLISIFLHDINLIKDVINLVIVNLGRDLMGFLSLFAVMMFQNFYLALVVIIMLLFVILPIAIVNKKTRQVNRKENSGYSELSSKVEESLSGIKIVKAYDMEEKQKNSINTIVDNIAHNMLRAIVIRSSILPIVETLGGICIGAVVIVGGSQVVKGVGDPGGFFAIVTALLLAYQPLKRMSTMIVQVNVGLTAAQRFYRYIDMPVMVLDKKGAKDVKITSAPMIRFNKVKLTYQEKGEKSFALNGIDFTIDAGTKVALVGRSGGGKSSIINAIMRFFTIDSGKILIDDTDIQDMTVRSLRGSISLVTQDIYLFEDTILNNVLAGNLKASAEEAKQAIKAADLEKFIFSLPQKYDTVLSAKGSDLSGGQKQRLSIARALLKNAPILLLDEATSALDAETENSVQQSIENLAANKTSIIIAHRFSTILGCDNILVIDDGKVVEQGKHEELAKTSYIYKRLYDLQIKKEE